MSPPTTYARFSIYGMRYCILLFVMLGLSLSLSGQTLSYDYNLPITDSLQQQFRIQNPELLSIPLDPSDSNFQIPTYFLPSYARRNPSGYSYLCRLELKIEDELPLGLWIRADEKAHPGGSLYLRMKVLRF